MITVRRSLIGSTCLALMVVVGWVALVIYRHAFHRSPWQQLPSQISACGRDYIYPDTGHPLDRAQASADAGHPFRPVASTGGWIRARPIWGHRTPGPDGAGIRCGYSTYVEVGPHRFVEYEISGGP